MVFPKDMLDTLGLAWPIVFATFGSTIFNAINEGLPSRLSSMISKNIYIPKRSGQIRAYNAVRKRIGTQAIGNRTDHILHLFNLHWIWMTYLTNII